MVPPLGSTQLMLFLLQIGVLLTLAIVLGRLAGRFGLPAIVGELTAGVLLGPSLLGWAAPRFSHWLLPAHADQTHLLDAVGQLSVLLLVGLTAIELDLGMVRRRGATAVRISLTGLLVPLILGLAVAFPLNRLLDSGVDPWLFALFLGVAMSVSAIPVIAKTLMDMNLVHRDVGQLTLSAGLVDDTVGWFLLSLVSAMAVGGLGPARIGLALAYLALVVVLALLSRPLVRMLLRRSEGSNVQVIAVSGTLILLAAAGTQALGLEGAFGAFLAGLVIGSSSPVVRARLSSLRTVVLALLAPIFFATTGLRIDLRALGRPPVLIAAVVVLVVAIVGKFAGAYLGARLSRMSRWEALALGAGMNARGVVEVVVAMVGLRLGILNTATYTIVVLVAVVTSVMAAPLLKLAMSRVETTPDEEQRLARGVLRETASV
jgi:Kef-type K+ transport system membrane component KefB